VWDHVFGTVYHGYDEKVLALKARIEGAGADASDNKGIHRKES